MLSGEAFDGVVRVEDGPHALQFLAGTHSAVVRVSYGLASSHVSGLDVCIEANGAAFECKLRAPLTALFTKGFLRGETESLTGESVVVGARARDEHERSFDLLAGAGRDLAVVGSLRLGQRVVLDGMREERRDPWPFQIPQAAA